MQNNLSFDVEFTRSQMEALLSDTDVQLVVVSGKYTYRPDLGTCYWEMNAKAEGYDNSKVKLSNPPQNGCPRPCP